MQEISSSIYSTGPPRADETGRVFFQPGGPPRDSSVTGRLGVAQAKLAKRSSSCSALPALLGAKGKSVGGRAGALCRGRLETSFPDQRATQELLRTILLQKVALDDADDEGEGEGADNDLKIPTSVVLDPVQEECRRKREDLDQRKKDTFIKNMCTSDTRHEVFDWVGKIYDLQKAKTDEEKTKKGKARPGRRRTRSSGVASDAGNSSTATGPSAALAPQLNTTSSSGRFHAVGTVAILAARMSSGDEGNTSSNLPLVQPVETPAKTKDIPIGEEFGGVSVVAETFVEPSLLSGESLVVHRERGIGDISHELRLHAYLGGQLPDLQTHVDDHIRVQSEAMSKAVDEQLSEKHLKRPRGPHAGFTFDGRAHFLKFQTMRREVLRKKLEDSTPQWIWEGILTWDPGKPSRHTKREDFDGHGVAFVYDNITKREGDSAPRAKSNNHKVTKEVPMFKPLHISYSMPHNWRDKYK